MTRTEVLAKVKELGIKTERPAHQMKTEALVALIHKTVVIEDHKARGRKINPASARQQRLANRAMLLENGPIQKGRKPLRNLIVKLGIDPTEMSGLFFVSVVRICLYSK